MVDEAVAASWALLRVHLAESGYRLNVNDLWIAATALTHRIPVVTQEDKLRSCRGGRRPAGPPRVTSSYVRYRLLRGRHLQLGRSDDEAEPVSAATQTSVDGDEAAAEQ